MFVRMFFESFCGYSTSACNFETFNRKLSPPTETRNIPKRKCNDVEMTRRTICLELRVLDFDEDDEDGDTNNHGMLMFESRTSKSYKSKKE